MYIGDWTTATPTEAGPWHYVEPGGHTMHVCMVKPRHALLADRAEAIVASMRVDAEVGRWRAVDELVAELGCITGELVGYVQLRASEGVGTLLGAYDAFTTNRSSSCVGPPPHDDLVPVTELNRWWCNAVVEPENGPPGFDTEAGAIDPHDIGEGAGVVGEIVDPTDNAIKRLEGES